MVWAMAHRGDQKLAMLAFSNIQVSEIGPGQDCGHERALLTLLDPQIKNRRCYDGCSSSFMFLTAEL